MTKRQVGILWGGDKEVTRSEGRGTIDWDRNPVRDGENCPRQGRVTGNGEKGTDGGGEWGVRSPVKELGFCTHPPCISV